MASSEEKERDRDRWRGIWILWLPVVVPDTKHIVFPCLGCIQFFSTGCFLRPNESGIDQRRTSTRRKPSRSKPQPSFHIGFATAKNLSSGPWRLHRHCQRRCQCVTTMPSSLMATQPTLQALNTVRPTPTPIWNHHRLHRRWPFRRRPLVLAHSLLFHRRHRRHLQNKSIPSQRR